MDRSLDSLSSRFKPLAIEFLARCVEANIPVMIINTGRTLQEAEALRKAGMSWTTKSKHVTGDAIDVCPWDVFQLNGPDKLKWDASDPVWLKLGLIGETVGLRWGGRWQQKDMGHFEYVVPAARDLTA